MYANDDATTREATNMAAGRDVFWQDAIPQQADEAGEPRP